jgi:hypothetical protein
MWFGLNRSSLESPKWRRGGWQNPRHRLDNGCGQNFQRDYREATHASDAGDRHTVARERALAATFHHAQAFDGHRGGCHALDCCIETRACGNRHRLPEQAEQDGYDQHQFKGSSHVAILCFMPESVKFEAGMHGLRAPPSF